MLLLKWQCRTSNKELALDASPKPTKKRSRPVQPSALALFGSADCSFCGEVENYWKEEDEAVCCEADQSTSYKFSRFIVGPLPFTKLGLKIPEEETPKYRATSKKTKKNSGKKTRGTVAAAPKPSRAPKAWCHSICTIWAMRWQGLDRTGANVKGQLRRDLIEAIKQGSTTTS